jgi:hypothetical protein
LRLQNRHEITAGPELTKRLDVFIHLGSHFHSTVSSVIEHGQTNCSSFESIGKEAKITQTKTEQKTAPLDFFYGLVALVLIAGRIWDGREKKSPLSKGQ